MTRAPCLVVCASAALASCSTYAAVQDSPSAVTASTALTATAFLSQQGNRLVDDGGGWWRIKGANYNLIEFDTKRTPDPAEARRPAAGATCSRRSSRTSSA